MQQNDDLATVYVRDEISRCEDIEELKEEIFPLLRSQQEQWKWKIQEIISDSGYTKTDFAKACRVSRVSVDKWCKGSIPKNRETFIKIGMAANYDIARMNQLLQRYGRYPALYSKSLEDCVCMFVLGRDYGADAIDTYNYILGKIRENVIHEGDSEAGDVTTSVFDDKLSEVKNESDLEQFITENSATFSFAYHKFYAYVKMNLQENYFGCPVSVFELAEGQGWSSSLRQSVSAIRQNKWYPTRNKIISLGLHLSMDHEQIDEMLKLAHMEPLCAKNIFESVIMFVLDDASLNNMLDADSDDYDPDELCRYARRILSEFDMPEMESFIAELPEMDDE